MNRDNNNYDKLIQIISPEATILKSWTLQGGITAKSEVLEFNTVKNETKKVIVRQFDQKNVDKYVKKIIKEYKLLSILKNEDIPISKPLYYTTNLKLFEYPVIVLEYIEGSTDFEHIDKKNYIRKMVDSLAKIHTTNIDKYDFSFLEEIQSGEVNEVNKKHYNSTKNNIAMNRKVLLHGDYWPGNIIWNDDEISGIIDWEDAFLGDPLQDVANSRLELLWAFDLDTMNYFTDYYRKLMPDVNFSYLEYWDKIIAKKVEGEYKEWFKDDKKIKDMIKKYEWFKNQSYD